MGSKKTILTYFLKRNSFHLLVTQLSLAEFEGKLFTDPKCSGPLLQTLQLKTVLVSLFEDYCCKCCNCSIYLCSSLSTTGTANPSQIFVRAHPYFFFSGDCNDPSTKTAIKKNFIGLLNQQYMPSTWCKTNDECIEDNIDVYCGNVTAAERRRRRSSSMQVSTNCHWLTKKGIDWIGNAIVL